MVYTSGMKVIIGLGNPEKRYDGTRHNVGFAVLDTYAQREAVDWHDTPKFKAHIATLPTAEKVLLVKPTTYYNLVGESVRSLADFYRIAPEDILIIYDDHALPFGVLRTREQGSDAGNNGIKSLNAHLGPDYARIRIGTHSDLRTQMGEVAFVLAKFSADESKKLQENIIPQVIELIHLFCAGNLKSVSHKNLDN